MGDSQQCRYVPAQYTGLIQGTGTIRSRITILQRIPAVPCDYTGTIESSGTIQPALYWETPRGTSHGKTTSNQQGISEVRICPVVEPSAPCRGPVAPYPGPPAAVYGYHAVGRFPDSAGMCQSSIPALFRAPALLGIDCR